MARAVGFILRLQPNLLNYVCLNLRTVLHGIYMCYIFCCLCGNLFRDLVHALASSCTVQEGTSMSFSFYELECLQAFHSINGDLKGGEKIKRIKTSFPKFTFAIFPQSPAAFAPTLSDTSAYVIHIW